MILFDFEKFQFCLSTCDERRCFALKMPLGRESKIYATNKTEVSFEIAAILKTEQRRYVPQALSMGKILRAMH